MNTAPQNDKSKAPQSPAGAGLMALLAVADFRRIWSIGIFSGIVRWLELLAFGIYVFDQSGSALLVATFTLLRFAPFGFVGALTGALVDRFGHRNVLRYSLLMMVLSAGTLSGLALFDRLELWHLGIATVLGGIYWTTDFPARRNYLGLLAGNDMLARALSFDAASNTLTRALGPLFGGALIAALGISGVLVLTFVAYLIAWLLALRLTPQDRPAHSVAISMARNILDGFKYASTRRKLLAAFAITVIYNLFGFPYTTLIPVIGKETLGLAPDAVGLIAALEGFGAMTGALLVARARSESQLWRTYIGGVVITTIGVAMMGLGQQVGIVAFSIAFAGLGGGLFAASQITLTYRLSPPEQRSRMLGILAICIGVAPLGLAWLGYIADLIGSGPSLLMMSAEGVVSLVLFWLIYARDVRAVDE